MDRGQSHGKRKRAEEESIEGALQSHGKRKRPEEESIEGASASSSAYARSGQYDVFLSFRGLDIRKTFTDYLYRGLSSIHRSLFIDPFKQQKRHLSFQLSPRIAMGCGQSLGKGEGAEEESIEGASASSSAYAISGQYDVFLSFRGSDTRKAFTDHLHQNLIKAGTIPICVFKDDNSIPIGEEFGSEILDAIARSKISIPIISENYASSKWCLRELIHIMDRKKSISHIVLPIFYKVTPSEVRHLKGNFGNAFRSQKHFEEKDIQEGQRALNEVSYLNGWESEKFANGHEGKLIEQVVETVISKLQEGFQLVVPKQLVGLDGRMKEIMNWINNPSTNARMIGIYGMGGIGKTTLAKCIYNQLLNKFKHASFLPDVRENTKCRGITYLQSQLLSDILNGKIKVSRIDYGINMIKSRFRQKKVLILLDDIDHKNQLDALAREHNWFMEGSLIIVTTRNKAILDQSEFEVDYKYELNGLDLEQALLLFNRHAFRRDHSPSDFEGISRDIVSTMGGLPLALEVVGAYLYKKTNRNVWEDVLKQLQDRPHTDVQKTLRISYDGLEEGHKQIFLDIACFFFDQYSTLPMYMWEYCDLYPSQGVEELKLRCLIEIDDDGIFRMHDQLKDLGRSIFGQEHQLEKHSRPWEDDYEGVSKLLRVERLGCDYSRFCDLMRASRTSKDDKLISELRYLRWYVSGSDLSLPITDLHLPNLSVLDLRCSHFTEDCEGWSSFAALKRLKVLNLSCCLYLRRTPDLSALTQLKILSLSYCYGLEHLHPSIGKLTSLVSLDLRECLKLKELPEEVGELKDLEELRADGCCSLREIPSSIGDLQNLQHLDLSFSEIEKLNLSESWRLKRLVVVECNNLVEIQGLDSAKFLEELDLTRCTSMETLPNLKGCEKLQSLTIRYCNKLTQLQGLEKLNIRHLNISGCDSLGAIPKLSGMYVIR